MVQGIKEKDIRDFVKTAQKLDKIIKQIREYQPDACLYLAGDDLCLMSSSPYEYKKAHQERIVETVKIEAADGGDW